MKRIGLVGLCLAVLAGTSFADQNLNPKVQDLLQRVIQQVKSGELTQSHLEALIRHQNPFEKKSTAAKQSADGTVRLFVDYAQPFSDMDCGFEWVNGDVTKEHLPINKRPNGEVEIKLFHFNRVVQSDEVIRAMDKEGYRPAELSEGLAYAKAYPKEQRRYPIAILGSVWQDLDGNRGVSPVWGGGGGLSTGLDLYGGGWRSVCRFLAVRK